MNGKRSNYLDAGSPTSCFLPSCKQAFVDKCTRGSDGHFYSSQKCAPTRFLIACSFGGTSGQEFVFAIRKIVA